MRWSGLDIQRQQSDARDLVALAPEVILSGMTTTTLALRNATQRIPILFVSLQDPVVNGVVSNLARPEANVTGFTGYEYSMAGKWLSLLKDAAPRLTRVALLFNPDTAPFAPFYLRAGQEAGERFKGIFSEVREEQLPAHIQEAMPDVVDVHLARAFRAQLQYERNLPHSVNQTERSDSGGMCT